MFELICKILFPFNLSSKCSHEKISPNIEQGYCPDCGKLIKNEWYITRCSCCGVKIKAMVKNGEIIPQHQYCTNCGSSNYSIEKLNSINFIDINFAALIKKEIEPNTICSTTRCWQEKSDESHKLLVQYL